MRRLIFSIIAPSAFLAVALAGTPVFARGGGGGHGGGGHGGGGGFHGGGGGGFRGGGGGFRGGGGGFRSGGGGFRGPVNVAPRAYSAPRAVMRAPTMRAPAMAAPRMQNFAGARGFQPGRATIGGMAGRAPLGAPSSLAGLGNRAGMGNFRSFGTPGFAGVNRSIGNPGFAGVNRSFGTPGFAGVNRGIGNNGFAGSSRINNFNNLHRTNFISNQSSFNNVNGFNNVAGRGYGGYGRSYGGYGGYGRGYGRGYGGYGGLGYGLGGYGLGYGLGGYGFPLGFLLGYGLGGYGGYGGYGLGGYGGYGGYSNWGYPSDYGYGGLGYAPSNWLYGGSLYGYGYSPYSNPYASYTSPGVVVAPFDYSQPINTVSAPPAQSVVDEASTLFGSARNSFKEGNFALALQQADAALAKNPNDSSLHEFRALCLFALGRYDEAASALYAVLSVGPGWDWPTLIGLYPNVNVYTAQLRALEDYCNANPQSSSSRFVLAYHYLTQGHLDAAANTLKRVVALKPNDTLSAKLLEQLQAARQNPAVTGAQPPPPPAPDSVPVNTALPEGATISGTWTAQRNPDTSVALTIQPGGAFHWQVNQNGQTQRFSGTSNFGGGLLTLVPDKSPPIVGRVSWTDPNHMTFRVVGDSPDAPGLSFSK